MLIFIHDENVKKHKYFITNLGKCTQVDARALPDSVYIKYLHLFEIANSKGIPFTIHAGENGNRPSDAGSSSTPEHELFIIQALVQEIHRTLAHSVFHKPQDTSCEKNAPEFKYINKGNFLSP